MHGVRVLTNSATVRCPLAEELSAWASGRKGVADVLDTRLALTRGPDHADHIETRPILQQIVTPQIGHRQASQAALLAGQPTRPDAPTGTNAVSSLRQTPTCGHPRQPGRSPLASRPADRATRSCSRGGASTWRRPLRRADPANAAESTAASIAPRSSPTTGPRRPTRPRRARGRPGHPRPDLFGPSTRQHRASSVVKETRSPTSDGVPSNALPCPLGPARSTASPAAPHCAVSPRPCRYGASEEETCARPLRPPRCGAR